MCMLPPWAYISSSQKFLSVSSKRTSRECILKEKTFHSKIGYIKESEKDDSNKGRNGWTAGLETVIQLSNEMI